MENKKEQPIICKGCKAKFYWDYEYNDHIEWCIKLGIFEDNTSPRINHNAL